MRTITLRLPQFGVIVATRAALGAGIGLLLSSRLSPRRCRAAGIGLVALGAVTTIPAARWIKGGVRPVAASAGRERHT
jgi:hypothetical protein